MPAEKPDFETLFESAPGLYLVLTPSLKIIAVSDAYLQATMTKREKILGCQLFEVFPDNPDDPAATGVGNLRASLERVLKDKVSDTMAVQKYDIRRPESQGGGFEERYWSPVNSPVFKRGGKEIAYMIHRVEDVTEFVRLKRLGMEQSKLTEDLKIRAGNVEAEIFLRAQELQEANKKLRETEEALRKAHDQLEARVQERTEELKKAQHQLIRQERLRAVGEMASGIAHDFNNALAPILGYTEVMLESTDLFEDRQKSIEYLRIMNTSAKDAAKVVSRLREFFRPKDQNEHFTSVDLNQIVNQTIHLTRPRWKDQAMAKGIDIHIKTDLGEALWIEGNETELREVLTNLIFNAADAMVTSGSINLTTQLQGREAVLTVQDTGSGMPEEVRQRCLEPFFTTKGDKGTGLGLSMVYGIIQRHKGSIEIQSEPGKGSAFSIRLPALTQSKPDSSAEEKRPQRSLRILYAEDDESIRKVIIQYLERDGHIVETAVNGREALEKFHKGRFDLVITDGGMPEMTGEQLASAIKKIAPAKPLILLSGTGDPDLKDNRPNCIDVCLPKPVTIQNLRHALAQF